MICLNTENCPYYQNWAGQIKTRNIDVILFYEDAIGQTYKCKAIESLLDNRVDAKEELRSKVKNVSGKYVPICPTLFTLRKVMPLEEHRK